MNYKEIFEAWKSSDRTKSFQEFKKEFLIENGIEIEEPIQEEIITPKPISIVQPILEKKDRVLRFRTTLSQLRKLEDYSYYNKISMSESIHNIIGIFFKERRL